jgi:hypothetical protein
MFALSIKRTSALLLTVTLLIPAAVSGTEMQVLFIGSSHTDANNMSGMFAGLAGAGGHLVYVDRSIVGGGTLSYHSHHQPTLDLIQEREWDHVVLQEHTLLTIIEFYVDSSFIPKATLLDSMITASGSNTAFYMHQAYPDPTGPYCAWDQCSREFVDYFDMQSEMSTSYTAAASELDALLVSVGDVWAAALHEDPTLPLWSSDSLHATVEGSYLNACVFYATFFNESPVGLEYYGGLEQARALMYQQCSHRFTVPQNLTVTVMNDSLLQLSWEPTAGSGYNIYSSETAGAEFPGQWIPENGTPVVETVWEGEIEDSMRFFRVTTVR